jgi:outer membrane lipoprotein SlyB
VASEADRWRWAEELPSDELGFAPYNVMAVFPALPAAEAAAADLRMAGFAEQQLSIRSRTMTDDAPAARVAPAVDAPTRRRDVQVAGRVFTKVVMLSAAVAAVAALIGFLVALTVGMSGSMTVIVTVVGAVAGSVVGAVWGGALGSMTEAQREEGVVLWARSDRRATAEDALRALRGHHPLRIDSYDGQGRPIDIG